MLWYMSVPAAAAGRSSMERSGSGGAVGSDGLASRSGRHSTPGRSHTVHRDSMLREETDTSRDGSRGVGAESGISPLRLPHEPLSAALALPHAFWAKRDAAALPLLHNRTHVAGGASTEAGGVVEVAGGRPPSSTPCGMGAGDGSSVRRLPGGVALAERAVLALSTHAINADKSQETAERARRVRDASAVAVISQAVARGQLAL
ncbi:hypothetical protein EON62_05225, partial [archaeon]